MRAGWLGLRVSKLFPSPLRWTLALLLGLTGSGCAPVSHPPAVRLNVLLILADDLGYMDVGFNNEATFYETPNLDRLARSGMHFTQGYAASPVCSPTRLSILTGKHPTRARATNWFSGTRSDLFLPAESVDHMALDETTLAEALREEGYRTFFAGKWHLGPTEETWPERQGFDENRGGHRLGGPYGGERYFSPYGNPRLEDGPPGEHLPDRLARETADFIARSGGDPFFAYLSFYSVHTPLMGREDLVSKYERKAAELPVVGEEFADEEQVWQTDAPRRVRTTQSHAVYAAMVEAMDEAVGLVLDRLEELGLAERTLVVFTSDNGGLSTSEGSPTSNLPLRGGKGWMYEGGIREPFVVRWPGVTRPGTRSDVPVVTTDIYPTVLEAVGAAPRPAQHVDGESLAPVLGGDGSLRRDALFWHYPHYGNQGGFPSAAVRVGDWKLIQRLTDGRVHLYDLASDPSELRDLATAQADVADDLRRRLLAWYEEVDARFLSRAPGGPLPWRP